MKGRSGAYKAWAQVAQVSLFVLLGIVSVRCFSQNSSTTALAATQAIERAAESAQISSKGMTRLVELRKETGVKQAIAVKLSIPAFAGGRVKIHLPGLSEVGISKRYETALKNGDRAWHGITDSGGDVTLIIGRASIEGHIVEQGKNYQLVLLDGEVHAVLFKELDFHVPTHKPQKTGALPLPMPMPGPPSYQPKPTESFSTLAAASQTVRIFVAYTPIGEQRTSTTIQSATAQAIARFNDALLTSGVPMQVEVAGFLKIQREFSSSSQALQYLAFNLPEVQLERDRALADVTVLVADWLADCGEAQQVGASPHTALAVVHGFCLVGRQAMAHEVGHLFGGRHDIFADGTLNPFLDGHGYWLTSVTGNTRSCWHTIMAIPAIETPGARRDCATDIRLQKWSS